MTARSGGYTCASFTTDYGLADGFVAACHGVVATIAPDVRLLDITHLVPPGDVRRGAAVLAQTVPSLPPGTVHVAVVDPGVGTARRAVAIETPAGALVGPDNGLLPPAADALGGVLRAVALSVEEWFRRPVSRTFHGRDIFSPVAAQLCRGVDLSEFGPPVSPAELIRLPPPVLRSGNGVLEAEVVFVDQFGNLQLAAEADDLAGLGTAPRAQVAVARLATTAHTHPHTATVAATFGDVPAGEPVLYVDSAGQAALAVNGGNAAERLGAAAGDTVWLRT